MKTAIIYATMSGHSKKIAQAISKELNLQAYNIKENPAINEYDLLFVVSGIYGGGCSPQLLEWAKNLSQQQVKSVALITSSMSNLPQKALRDTLCANGIIVKEKEYLCVGSFLFMKLGHPNKSEIASAIEFAKETMKDCNSK
ncbi:MAG: flavodoxin domain-containing protein [Oscillospiraceae bacterium]